MKFPDLKAKETPPNHTWTRKQAKEMQARSNSALLPAGSVLRSGATGWDQALWLPLHWQESSPHLKVAHTGPEMWGSALGLWELHSVSWLPLAKHLLWVYQQMSVMTFRTPTNRVRPCGIQYLATSPSLTRSAISKPHVLINYLSCLYGTIPDKNNQRKFYFGSWFEKI